MAKVVKSDEPLKGRAEAHRAESDAVRITVAKVVRVLFLLLAVVLALAAFLVAAQDNVSQDNVVVKLIFDIAEAIDGPFSRENGIFSFNGANADIKDAVVNWGIGALVYLAIGRYLQRLLAPKSHR